MILYLDDICVHSRNPEEHLEHLEAVLDVLAKNNFYCKLAKCDFLRREICYLGRLLSAAGVRMDPRKSDVISRWPAPTTVTELRSFLGLANYSANSSRATRQ